MNLKVNDIVLLEFGNQAVISSVEHIGKDKLFHGSYEYIDVIYPAVWDKNGDHFPQKIPLLKIKRKLSSCK